MSGRGVFDLSHFRHFVFLLRNPAGMLVNVVSEMRVGSPGNLPTAFPCSAWERAAAMRLLLRTALLLGFSAAAVADTPVALPVDGEPFPARLAAVDADWGVTFTTDGAARKLSPAGLVRWGAPAEVRRGPVVVTAQGGLLVGDVLRADPAEVAMYADLLGKLTLPTDRLAGVVFDLPPDPGRRDRLLLRVAGATGGSDRVLLSNGDDLTGTVERLAEGTLSLRTDVGQVELARDRIAAVVFNPELRRPPVSEGLRAWVGMADGSRLLASKLVLDDKAAVLTALGAEDLEALPRDVVFLQPLAGQVVYLSDLEPAGYRYLPYLSLSWPYHRDRSVVGTQLRAAGQLYLKGLGMHSASRLSYDLGGQYRQFQAELAVDDSAAARGSVQFRVYVDRELKYTSETLRGGDAPVPLRVDVAGAKRLDLIVDFADQAHVLDHADWLDARLVRAEGN
jgi:hypothetical protein